MRIGRNGLAESVGGGFAPPTRPIVVRNGGTALEQIQRQARRIAEQERELASLRRALDLADAANREGEAAARRELLRNAAAQVAARDRRIADLERELSILSAQLHRGDGENARPDPQRPTVAVHGRLRLDLHACRLWVGEAEVPLTKTEWMLCRALFARPGHLVTRERMLAKVWPDYALAGLARQSHHLLLVSMARLRRKLKPHGAEHLIETVFGVGLRLLPLDRIEAAS